MEQAGQACNRDTVISGGKVSDRVSCSKSESSKDLTGGIYPTGCNTAILTLILKFSVKEVSPS